MVMFVNITRWRPETARALPERWMTVINGTAPKPVLDAFAKMKNHYTDGLVSPNHMDASHASMSNHFSTPKPRHPKEPQKLEGPKRPKAWYGLF